jgi:uncharacterized cupin superfamily protein
VDDYTVVGRQQALDLMADYPGYGEMRMYAAALGSQQVALTWRRMPPGTGGRGSYGHRHHRQEELYLVIAGELTAKIGDDIVKLEAGDALRVAPSAFRSIHNDGSTEAELVICSVKVDDPRVDVETAPGFWPDDS